MKMMLFVSVFAGFFYRTWNIRVKQVYLKTEKETNSLSRMINSAE